MTPTRKWWAARIAAAGTFATLLVNDGWHKPATVVLIGLVVQGAVSWLTPNDKITP